MNIDNSNHLPVGFPLGDFSIVRVAGEGGFSVVYVANDNLLGRTVAIKEYIPSTLAARGRDLVTVQPRSSNTVDGFQAGLRSFIREARLLAQFSHPAIVEVYRVWEQNGTAYIAMRFLKGETLSQHLRNERVFSEAELRAILEPIFDAIDLLHSQSIIHRDVSPDNIILADGQPVLLDLGAARAVVAGLTQALTSVLKPGYAPLEQYADDGSLQQGTWTDVYAIAGVLYKLATGVTPVQAIGRVVVDPMPSLQSLTGNFSTAFAESVMAGLAVFPEHRIKTVSELRDRLGWRVGAAQVITTKVPVVGDAESATAVVQTLAKMPGDLFGAPVELPRHANQAAGDLDDRTVVVPGAKRLKKKVSLASPITGTGESSHLIAEPDNDLTAAGHGQLAKAALLDPDPVKRESEAVTNRRWYVACASLALLAMLIGTYRFWSSTENSAVPSRDSVPSSSIAAAPVVNHGSSAVDARAPRSLPLGAPSPAHQHASTVEAVVDGAVATSASGETNAQNRRSTADGGASGSSPNSSSAAASSAELLPRGAIGRKYLRGDTVELALKTDGTGHAYCFWLDEAQHIIRIHPNRFNKSTLVSADKPLALPGTSEFSLVAERPGVDQIVECHVVAKEVLSMLPAHIGGADLAVLSVQSLGEVRNAFARAVGTGGPLVVAADRKLSH